MSEPVWTHPCLRSEQKTGSPFFQVMMVNPQLSSQPVALKMSTSRILAINVLMVPPWLTVITVSKLEAATLSH